MRWAEPLVRPGAFWSTRCFFLESHPATERLVSPAVRNIDADIIHAARLIVSPPFIRAIRALDETVARELARDRLALDQEYQDAALALETSPEQPALALCDWPVEEPVEPVESAPAASSVDGYL